jgi:MFS family permease
MGFRDVLKIPAVRRLWLAQLVSVFGDFLAIYAIFSVVSFQMHAPATEISLIMVAYLLPLAVISPIAGVFVDSWNVKRTMIASDLIRAGLFLLLLFATSLWQIYAILLLVSTVSSFFVPAQSITVRTLVPQEGLLSANALIQQAWQVMQIVSPAIAGLLVATLGPASCFWIDAATFVLSAWMLSTITVGRQPASAVKTVRSVFTELKAGAAFILTHPAVSYVVISMAAGLFAFRCFGALIAVYVRDVLAGGSSLFGALGSMIGVGMIIGTQFIHRAARNRPPEQVVATGLIGVAIAIVALAAVTLKPVVIAAMLATGFFVAFVVIPAQTLLQQHTPPHLLGRVSGAMMTFMFGSQVVALYSAGALANGMGIRNVYYASAVLLVLIAIAGRVYLTRRTKGTAEAATGAA